MTQQVSLSGAVVRPNLWFSASRSGHNQVQIGTPKSAIV